jgi:hypothetical protein
VDLEDFALVAEQWLQVNTTFHPAPRLPLPIALWKMDETQGAFVKDSVNAYHGQMYNFPATPWTTGFRGNALQFDGGDSYVDVTGFRGITGRSSRTCAAWIKFNQYRTEQVILSWGGNAAGQKWMFRLQSNDKLAVGVWGGYIQTEGSMLDDQGYHVAAVLADDGTPRVDEIKLYINGRPREGTASSIQAIDTAASQNVQIGSVYNGTTQTSVFYGLIDDVRIYDTALTDDQILSLVNE